MEYSLAGVEGALCQNIAGQQGKRKNCERAHQPSHWQDHMKTVGEVVYADLFTEAYNQLFHTCPQRNARHLLWLRLGDRNELHTVRTSKPLLDYVKSLCFKVFQSVSIRGDDRVAALWYPTDLQRRHSEQSEAEKDKTRGSCLTAAKRGRLKQFETFVNMLYDNDYIYIYIQTGSLKTVGQNDIPSRNPVFCVLLGHVFLKICANRTRPVRKHFLVFWAPRSGVSTSRQFPFFGGVRRVFCVRCFFGKSRWSSSVDDEDVQCAKIICDPSGY